MDTLGALWIFHLLPFHRSTSVPAVKDPTAVHALDEEHETPTNSLLLAPVGFGVGWTDHPEPPAIAVAGSNPSAATPTVALRAQRVLISPRQTSAPQKSCAPAEPPVQAHSLQGAVGDAMISCAIY